MPKWQPTNDPRIRLNRKLNIRFTYWHYVCNVCIEYALFVLFLKGLSFSKMGHCETKYRNRIRFEVNLVLKGK